MTALEWVGIIILVIAIVFSVSVFVFALAKARKEGFTNKRVSFLLASLGVLFIAYLSFNIRQIEPADGLQIMLMLGLVTVTGIYAFSAVRQAEAGVKMAEEMKEQRYDMIRPVIDIKRDTARADINRRGIEAYAASSGETSHGLSGILCNIGPGPAIDVRSFIQHPERERLPWQFGTIESGGKTERMILSISHEDNRMALVAYYEDIYGRTFESSREVSAGKKGEGWEIGPLKIIPQVKERKKP